jgi:hypothetical protein
MSYVLLYTLVHATPYPNLKPLLHAGVLPACLALAGSGTWCGGGLNTSSARAGLRGTAAEPPCSSRL